MLTANSMSKIILKEGSTPIQPHPTIMLPNFLFATVYCFVVMWRLIGEVIGFSGSKIVILAGGWFSAPAVTGMVKWNQPIR